MRYICHIYSIALNELQANPENIYTLVESVNSGDL